MKDEEIKRKMDTIHTHAHRTHNRLGTALQAWMLEHEMWFDEDVCAEGIWLAMLVHERVLRRIIQKAQMPKDVQVQFIRAAKDIGDMLYQRVMAAAEASDAEEAAMKIDEETAADVERMVKEKLEAITLGINGDG